MEQQLYKLKDAAKILAVSFPWIDKRVRAGEINVVMMGAHRCLNLAEINRIKEEGIK